MSVRRKFISVLLFVFSVFLFSACEDLNRDIAGDNSADSGDFPKTEGTAQDEEGPIIVTVGSSDEARTAFPTVSFSNGLDWSLSAEYLSALEGGHGRK